MHKLVAVDTVVESNPKLCNLYVNEGEFDR